VAALPSTARRVTSATAVTASRHRFSAQRPEDVLRRMPRKPIELPPAVARAFVKDMRAFLVEKNAIKRDEIAVRQLHALKQHCTGKLGFST
jgi:hypothetical protein